MVYFDCEKHWISVVRSHVNLLLESLPISSNSNHYHLPILPRCRKKARGFYRWSLEVILLMAEILHQLIGSLSHYLQGFIHPRWYHHASQAKFPTPHVCKSLPCALQLLELLVPRHLQTLSQATHAEDSHIQKTYLNENGFNKSWT